MPEPDHQPEHELRLEHLAGPAIETVVIEPNRSITLGRSARADVVLDDPGVSRMHARVSRVGGAWVLADLTSKHGTHVNANRLDPDDPTPLAEGDLVRLGPWTFRVRTGAASTASIATSDDDRARTASRIRAVPVAELAGIAQHRLDLLIDCAASISAATDIDRLADVVLDACRAGAGYARAALVRPLGSTGDVEVLASRAPSASSAEPLRLSRSLIEGASAGRVVRLESDALTDDSHSIVSLGIHSATCLPIMIGASVEACLYLDARDAERRVSSDATAFCLALARLTGLAMSNIKRVETERNRAVMEGDLRAARSAQRVMLPPPAATLGGVRYAMTTLPGRIVAGDLFDVVPLEGGRVAVFLGDVSGKGAGAAMLMAMVQTHLALALRLTDDPATVVADVNASLAPRLTDGQFISLWLGVFDPGERSVRFVDAGHGHCLFRRAGEAPQRIMSAGGLPVGVIDSAEYTTESLELGSAGRVILYSDGAVEQPDPAGELFRLDRVIDALAPSPSADRDVSILVEAVKAHAAGGALTDDLTVASVELISDK